MKNLNFIKILVLIVSSVMFIQCTSDNTVEFVSGPAGADGIDGVNGTNGVDGVDGSAASCIACHAKSHLEPIEAAYMAANHSTGSSWARGTSTSCAQCHNNEGYVDYLSGLYLDDDGYKTVNPDGYAVSNPITCTGCHDSHRSFDFENDGNDYAVRNIDPVYLVLDQTTSIDFKNDADPLGLSNACTTCHQPRNSYAIPVGTGDYTITSQRFGPHHGPQATVLEGIMGANYAGAVGYPGVGTAAHRTGASCTSCHMGESNDGTGGHSWAPTEESCLECHSTVPTSVAGFDADFTTLLGLLKAKNYIADNDEYILGADGMNNASSSNPLVVPVKEAQAIWNYKTLYEDKSKGIHNPVYSMALLKNSIEALQDN
jgi:hypothetical protein